MLEVGSLIICGILVFLFVGGAVEMVIRYMRKMKKQDAEKNTQDNQ
jgi:hypothetical protein